MDPNVDNSSWVFDSLVGFLHGPIWNAPLQTFIEEKSLPFEPTESGEVCEKPEYKKVFDEYRNLVDMMLGTFMEDIGITAAQFEAACRRSRHELHALPAPFHRRLFEQVWAANDYAIFTKMMAHRNVELQLQVDMMLGTFMEDIGITAAQFEAACRRSRHELHALPAPFHRRLFEQVWAANDYAIFTKMMAHRNVELQLQVDMMLGTFMEDIGITAAQFEAACRRSRHELHALPAPFHRRLFEQVWAANDYAIFTKMMAHRNVELQLQVDMMLGTFMEDIGITAAQFEAACRRSRHELHALPAPFHRRLFEQVWAANDYAIFTKMMAHRNVELQLQVDMMLGTFMEDIGITAAQFEAACRRSRHELHALPAPFHRRLFEQVWAANDYAIFTKMMAHRNVELQLQVDMMLGTFMEDIGITAAQFEAACRRSRHELHALPAPFHRRLFEQVWAANDYAIFTKMMAHRNVELQLQVDMMLGTFMEDIGITAAQFEAACRRSRHELHALPAPFHRRLFEQVWAANDYAIFTKMMAHRNIELQLQVDMMLGTFMEDIGITAAQFEAACRRSRHELHALPAPFHRRLFEQVWAANDYAIFTKMMAHRNVELQLQLNVAVQYKEGPGMAPTSHVRCWALELIEREVGALPHLFLSDELQYPRSPRAADDDWPDREDIMAQIEKLQLSDDSDNDDDVVDAPERPKVDVGAEKKILRSKLVSFETKVAEQPAAEGALPPPAPADRELVTVERSASAAPAKREVSEEEVQQRQEYLKRQRDKLLALKRQARERQLAAGAGGGVGGAAAGEARPASARAARALLAGSAAPAHSDPALQLRRALADRLRSEVVDGKP